MSKNFLAVIILLSLLAIAFYKYGRSWYQPIVNKVRGKATVASVQEDLLPFVQKRLQAPLSKLGLNAFPEKIGLVAIKDERLLEVYAETGEKWQLLRTYPFTAFSGKTGPKLKEGDRQIPEGIYKISFLNPNSSYYLSLKVNYPNDFDKQQAHKDGRTKLGGDIFIHGKDVTIGCIPVGDPAIEELFLLAAHARTRGIPVIIAPTDFRKGKIAEELSHIDWEAELYRDIANALQPFSQN